MHRLITSIALLFLCFFMTACSRGVIETNLPGEPDSPVGIEIFSDDTATVKEMLYEHYEQWKGIRYRLGGLDKNGIDCSGFVYVTYLEMFDIALPRTTRLQAQIGRAIPFNELRSGDLVFFKIGWKTRHVGIYIENNMFLHVSTKKGVMISCLNDVYWGGRYWKARRIDF
ncbi:putative endopeptidase Spr [Desulfamplus magnetovallimortis]|uniref:Putative endopeptidase Spr n=1 Tax=Desulfamplus magnetovallimortis TaxID=1246637 RepID=A0A1W1HFU8_9BACT|nr:NlpC/P60 family protein [Desulfamplus magnetovallimortis]SLM31252.1 putative endopeptidase Spr [Desulfamplus magnetovallimortis]